MQEMSGRGGGKKGAFQAKCTKMENRNAAVQILEEALKQPAQA